MNEPNPQIQPAIFETDRAIEWLAAAIYSQYVYDPLGRMPHFDELPHRLKEKWREISRQWLHEIIPMLIVERRRTE